MRTKKYEPELAFDGDYCIVGDHLTLEQVKESMKEYDPEIIVKKIDHFWARHGILPEHGTTWLVGC